MLVTSTLIPPSPSSGASLGAARFQVPFSDDMAADLPADRAGGAVQPALHDVPDPVPPGRPARTGPPPSCRIESFVSLLDEFAGLERAAPAGARRADDAPAVLRHGRVRGRSRHPGDHEHELHAASTPRRADDALRCGLDCRAARLDRRRAWPATYEAIRVRGRFDRLLRNLDRVRRGAAHAGSRRARVSTWWPS